MPWLTNGEEQTVGEEAERSAREMRYLRRSRCRMPKSASVMSAIVAERRTVAPVAYLRTPIG
jgi:hypothetical protein